MKIYTAEDIARECAVREQTIVTFIKYRMENNLEIPNPIPYAEKKYSYTRDDAIKIATLFKTKKRGEMSKYNYEHNYGVKFRNKYKRDIKKESNN